MKDDTFCPFCGMTMNMMKLVPPVPEHLFDHAVQYGEIRWQTGCTSCGYTMRPCGTRDGAVAAAKQISREIKARRAMEAFRFYEEKK